jgi:hypothetical protein
MAYAITKDNNLLRIAANETEKNELTAMNENPTVIDISDSDFNKLKNRCHTYSISGNTITISEITEPGSYANVDELFAYHNDLKRSLETFINNANTNTKNKTLYTQAVNYKNYLDSFDLSTVTFPITNWEKYCEDNSITYLNLLQIP